MLHKYSCVLTAISIRIGLLSSKVHNGDDTKDQNTQSVTHVRVIYIYTETDWPMN